MSKEEVRNEVARALVLARCESGLNPSLLGGDRSKDAPAGLFQLDGPTVSSLAGGPAADPVANSDAAARLYLDRRRSGVDGFSPWPCARSLPASGGALPAWAYRW
jgi:hypothetical protein